MFRTINEYEFVQAFDNMGLSSHFSLEGRLLLFAYLDEIETEIGEPMELDVIGICNKYAEDTPDEIAEDYDIDLSECEKDGDGDYEEDQLERIVLEHLNEHNMVVGTTSDLGTIVFKQF